MKTTHRVVVIDDNPEIHNDFRKILRTPEASAPLSALHALENSLFDDPVPAPGERPIFEVDCASQGQEGLELVKQALADSRPYSLAFVDMRMPPGWDGLRTTRELLKVAPQLRVVICTAYSDYTLEEITRALNSRPGQVSYRSKPFDAEQILQLAADVAAPAVTV